MNTRGDKSLAGLRGPPQLALNVTPIRMSNIARANGMTPCGGAMFFLSVSAIIHSINSIVPKTCNTVVNTETSNQPNRFFIHSVEVVGLRYRTRSSIIQCVRCTNLKLVLLEPGRCRFWVAVNELSTAYLALASLQHSVIESRQTATPQ